MRSPPPNTVVLRCGMVSAHAPDQPLTRPHPCLWAVCNHNEGSGIDRRFPERLWW